MSIWDNIWDERLSLYTDKLYYDAKYKLPKKVIIFFYLFGGFDHWKYCFDKCETDELLDQWEKRVNETNDFPLENVEHWAKKLQVVLKKCAKEIALEGSLKMFGYNVFEKEKPENCDISFIYTLYLSLYCKEKIKAASFVAQQKELRRDTYPLITEFVKQHGHLDALCLLNICLAVYAME